MKKKLVNYGLVPAFTLSALSLAVQAQAQDMESFKPTLEEVVVVGRMKSAAQDIVIERMESEQVVDFIGAEQIARVGDSTVAQAVRRVPGLTLVDGKYVYVRGLGERYASTLLNGASVPSPDLTRSVLPLDILPSSIVSSIAVQKTFSADMPANFGGGSVDIRTNGIPNFRTFTLELSGGFNSISDDLLTYNGGSDDKWGKDDGTRGFSSAIDSALRTYRTSVDAPEGDVSPQAIQATFARNGQDITLAQAEAINAQLASEVYRDLNISEESKSLNDSGISLTVGDLFDLGNMWEVGVLADLSYDKSTRSTTSYSRDELDPDEEFKERNESNTNVSITAALNFGVRYGDDHRIESKNLFLRNTDDEVYISNNYTQSTSYSSGQGFRDYGYRFEERELEIYQLEGSHQLGYDTREKLGLSESIFDDLKIEWFYSDSTATTSIPSETSIQAQISRDVANNVITSTSLLSGPRMMNVRFTDLEDQVESSGIKMSWPFTLGDFAFEITAGSMSDRKTRTYKQTDFSIGSTNTSSEYIATLNDPISSALSDENILNPDYDYRLIYQSGLSRSYIAAVASDAYYGDFEVFWNETLRLEVGARFEDYKQFSCPWQPYRVIGSQVRFDPTDQSGEFPDCTFQQDDIYPTLAATYIRPDFLAEEFQLRFGVSETNVKPDLREVSDASYRDPLDENVIVSGNPDVRPSGITNYDVRAEWMFSTGDNLAISMFYKDITDPIAFFLSAGAENTQSATIENAESGSIKGVEIEWLKYLSFLGDFASQFYVSGNLTLADSELVVGDAINVNVKNRVRSLDNASDYVINFQLGFDSEDEKHAATLVFNEYGERVRAGGIGSLDDSMEQPFTSLDLVYTYYPTESVTVKFSAKNILEDNVEVKTGDIVTYEREVGTSYGLSVKYNY
ncbi:TonB-dependent receptor plug domain-containing protein [Spongiibacter sp. KMU-158]|uniref:TonB-dependent receptor plug domain-containing protein n=1 Tax=Spongiibacter pelagi TaxID=2760804 RepID=A0A927GW02_9GAMM|nr:TonB-dependent receptor [Spongiibacter pelagi]MBD2857914.1 TonB-dependent receptor plug domain-containing protein [Spongiibacter pelagi]